MSTPFPTNQVQFDDAVTHCGNVPVSNAGLSYTNWPDPWGNQPPASDPNPNDLPATLAHVGFNVAKRLGGVNAWLLQANQEYQGNGSVSGGTWGQLNAALSSLNGFFRANPGLTFPLVPLNRITTLTPSQDYDVSFGNYTGTLTIHVDAESTVQDPTPSQIGSWQVVTGFVISLGDSFEALGGRSDSGEEDEDEMPGGGGGSSSSSYYASSSSP